MSCVFRDEVCCCDNAVCVCSAGNGQARHRLGETVGTMLTVCLVFSEMKFAVVIVLSVCVVLAMARPGLELPKEKDTLLEERILNMLLDTRGNLPLYN